MDDRCNTDMDLHLGAYLGAQSSVGEFCFAYEGIMFQGLSGPNQKCTVDVCERTSLQMAAMRSPVPQGTTGWGRMELTHTPHHGPKKYFPMAIPAPFLKSCRYISTQSRQCWARLTTDVTQYSSDMCAWIYFGIQISPAGL